MCCEFCVCEFVNVVTNQIERLKSGMSKRLSKVVNVKDDDEEVVTPVKKGRSIVDAVKSESNSPKISFAAEMKLLAGGNSKEVGLLFVGL